MLTEKGLLFSSEVMLGEVPWLGERSVHRARHLSNRFLRAGVFEFSLGGGSGRVFERVVAIAPFDLRNLLRLDLSGGPELFRAERGGDLFIFKRRSRTKGRVDRTGIGSGEMGVLGEVGQYEMR